MEPKTSWTTFALESSAILVEAHAFHAGRAGPLPFATDLEILQRLSLLAEMQPGSFHRVQNKYTVQNAIFVQQKFVFAPNGSNARLQLPENQRLMNILDLVNFEVAKMTNEEKNFRTKS